VTFIDDMCPGLSFKDDAKIYFGDDDTTGTSLTLENDIEEEKITTAGEYKDGYRYTYSIADLKTTAASLGAGDVIKITYTATLTDDAVIGAPGNPNSYKVVYASDPNWTATPGPGETTPPEPPTSETPAKKNVVFTYKLIVNKVDDDGNDLTGANFALYKWTDPANPADVNAAGWTIVGAEITATDISAFEFNGLDDGIYKLVETKTPDASYNQIDPIMFEITATHNDTDYSFVLDTDLPNSNVSGGEITVEVENNKGIVLPGTGGIGTTIFYIVGSLMVTGALVLFIVRKRMSIKEK
jgi:fimbrial isopeptide formation D2 family protein/LPXTG-motif cell wall-anchored protein